MRHVPLLLSALCLFVSEMLAGPASLTAEDWPAFRGPNGDGVSPDGDVPTTWSDAQNLKWKLELPGKGFSSPVVVGGNVLVTAWSGDGAAVTRHLLCVDRAAGKVKWTRTVEGPSDGASSGFAYHGSASHTPVSDGKRVYCMFGRAGVHVYDMEGAKVWSQDVGQEQLARFGSASSPILHGDALIVSAGSESASMRAFNKQTGEQLWSSEANSLSQSYSTPRIVQNKEGGDELLISVARELWALNPESGKLRWFAETDVDTAACPALVVKDGVAYVVGGRSGGRTAVRVGGKGDVTASNQVWSRSGGSYVPSPVLHNNHLYWIDDRGVAHVVDIKTGEETSRKRVGGRFYSSLVLAGDKLIGVSRFSGAYVFTATPELKQLAQNKLSDDSDFSASPAISDGQIFLRSDEALYCIAAEE